MTPTQIKIRENLCRRQARRRLGLELQKSTRKDRLAPDYGLFALVDPKTDKAINKPLPNGAMHSWTLEQVERHLSKPRARTSSKHIGASL
jgi:hypothetical protein